MAASVHVYARLRAAAAADTVLVHNLLEGSQFSHMIPRNVFVAEF